MTEKKKDNKTENKKDTITEDAYKIALEQNKELSKLYEKELIRNQELSKHIDENKVEIQSLKDKLEIASICSKQALECMQSTVKHSNEMFYRRVKLDNKFELITNIVFLTFYLAAITPGIILFFKL